MKSKSLLLCTAAFLTIALPATVHAGNKGDKKGGKKAAKEVISLYDKNGNGVIDGDEVAAVQKAYVAEPNGILKQFDTNADGKLDDTEVAAIKAGKGGKKKKNKAA